MKRLFIAINIPAENKKRIEIIVEGLKDIVNQDKPKSIIRWLPPENWHLTLAFLGYQPDEAINPILESIKETVKKFPAPTVKFENIIWAPPNKPPRMFWLTGTKEISEKLDEIKKYLENRLSEKGVRFQRENRPYNAHLTLCRFSNQSLIPFANIREFNSRLIRGLSFTVQSFDLMESHLKRSGAEYEVLARLTFSAPSSAGK